MATEYRLSYTATEIDEKLGKIDDLETLTQWISDWERNRIGNGW